MAGVGPEGWAPHGGTAAPGPGSLAPSAAAPGGAEGAQRAMGTSQSSQVSTLEDARTAPAQTDCSRQPDSVLLMAQSSYTVPRREAKDPGGVQYCLAKIFRWGADLAPHLGIAVSGIFNLRASRASVGDPLLSHSPTHPPPQSPQGGPWEDGCGQDRLSS